MNPILQSLFIVIALLTHYTVSTAQEKKENYTSSSKKAISYYKKAQTYIKKRDFENGIKNLLSAIDKDPNFAEAHQALVACYIIKNDVEKVKYHLKNIYVLQPTNPSFQGSHLAFAELLFNEGNYTEAYEVSKKTLTLPNLSKLNQDRAEKIKSNCLFSIQAIEHPSDFHPSPLPETVNHFTLQYFPVLTADQQFIIFTGRNGFKGNDDENIFISEKKNGSWQPCHSISKNINTPLNNEGTCTISADGKIIIFTSCQGRESIGNCDLYVSYKTGADWSEPKNLGSTVNSIAWDSQPSLSADGRQLYFVSERKGGYGKRDIWYTKQDANGNWSIPTNLGPTINTKENEISPFIHTNGTTLFFASNGYPELGGLDLFYSTQHHGKWNIPTNLGYPINNHKDQSSLFVTADGKKGYYTNQITDTLTQKTKGLIYEFNFPPTIISTKSNYVKGIIRDKKTKKELKSKIDLFDLKTNQIQSIVYSDSIDGNYLITLTQGSEYALYIRKKGYLFKSIFFNYVENRDLNPITLDIELDPIQAGSSTVLNNIFFDFGKYNLKEKSTIELENIIEFIKQNPELKFEIGGHTDDIGSEKDNQTLSIERAKAVYTYLIEKGISKNKLIYKGYGKSKPIISNITEENRQLNRRIEFRILK